MGVPISTALSGVLAELGQEKAPPGIPTGLKSVDRVLGGLERGCLHLVVGRRGTYHLLETLVANVAARGSGVLYLSSALRAEHVAMHLLAGRANVSPAAIQRGVLDAGQRRALGKAARWLNYLPVVIDDRPPETAAELTGLVEDAREQLGVTNLAMVACDDLESLPGSEAAAKTLRRIARRFGVAVVAAYHVPDAPDDDGPGWDKLPKAVERESEALLFLAATRKPDDWAAADARKEVLVSKSRIGAGRRVLLKWRLDVRRVEDLPEERRSRT